MRDYTIEQIQRLCFRIYFSYLSIPNGFLKEDVNVLQIICNGVGPEKWSSRFRRFITLVFTFLEMPAMIHDWEFVFQPKTYWHFTIANLRLIYNAILGWHFLSGLVAGIFCQVFGWSSYKTNSLFKLKSKEEDNGNN